MRADRWPLCQEDNHWWDPSEVENTGLCQEDTCSSDLLGGFGPDVATGHTHSVFFNHIFHFTVKDRNLDFFFFVFLGPHSWHMEVSRLEVELEP